MRSWSTLRGAALASLQLSEHLVLAATQSPCEIVADQQLKSLENQNYQRPNDIQYLGLFDAETAYECLKSVPLYTNEAAQMLEYMKKYWTMQSTLAYLKDPPKSYQQPGVDLMAGLDELSDKLADGAYSNQYEFDLDVMSLTSAAHEGHLQISFGTMYLIKWLLPDNIVSISSDGQEIPQLYAYSDVVNKVDDASPITRLGGEPAFAYLRKYLDTKIKSGCIEPHADFNTLMHSSASAFSRTGGGTKYTWYPTGLSMTNIYNGPSLKGQFANGTNFEWMYFAGSEYNFTRNEFFSGDGIYSNYIKRASSTESRDLEGGRIEEPTVSARDTNSSPRARVPNLDYPDDPIVVQANFSSGGTVSGYLLQNGSVGVLSVPSFSAPDAAAFGDAVNEFIMKAKKAEVKKIVIDVQANGGGSLFVGYDFFKRFFPNIDPLELFRARALEPYHTYGSVISDMLSGRSSGVSEAQIEGVREMYGAKALLNIEGHTIQPNHTRWKTYDDMFDGKEIYGDAFTNPIMYNLSSPLTYVPISGYAQALPYDEPPFAAEDIVFLTDGYCASTCHTVQMFLKNEAGVKTVVVGGVPQYGPMQGVAGTRGGSLDSWSTYSELTKELLGIQAQAMSGSSETASDLLSYSNITEDDIDNLFPIVDKMPWNASPNVNGMNIVRVDSPDITRQFVYEAADCRLFYTGEMYRDITQLWLTAAKYGNGDESVCVPGSLNAPGSGINNTLLDSPGFSYKDTWDNANSTDIPDYSNSTKDNDQDNKSKDEDEDEDSAATTITLGATKTVMLITLLSGLLLL